MAPPGTGPDPFPISDFDEWAETYDASVISDEYPFFQGYMDVLTNTVEQTRAQPGMPVLDLGTGTGNLALLLDRLGCEMWCIDFSEAMLAQARRKLPKAHFSLHDLRGERWPAGFPPRFERIVSAYVFHHFELDEKVRIINGLMHDHLFPGGQIVLADIAFPNRKAFQKFGKQVGDQWEEEPYWVADEILPALKNAGLRGQFMKVSPCAGIFTLQA